MTDVAHHIREIEKIRSYLRHEPADVATLDGFILEMAEATLFLLQQQTSVPPDHPEPNDEPLTEGFHIEDPRRLEDYISRGNAIQKELLKEGLKCLDEEERRIASDVQSMTRTLLLLARRRLYALAWALHRRNAPVADRDDDPGIAVHGERGTSDETPVFGGLDASWIPADNGRLLMSCTGRWMARWEHADNEGGGRIIGFLYSRSGQKQEFGRFNNVPDAAGALEDACR